jgi:hypothetical protein
VKCEHVLQVPKSGSKLDQLTIGALIFIRAEVPAQFDNSRSSLICEGSAQRSRQGRSLLIAPRTEPYERHYRIRLPPWRVGERCCYSHTAPSLEHSFLFPHCVG